MLELDNVTQRYQQVNRRVIALRGIDLRVLPGERVVVVGRSGAGKSTLARIVTGQESPSAGAARFDGRRIPLVGTRDYRRHAHCVQYISQNAAGALNPSLRVSTVIGEALRNRGVPRSEQIGLLAESLQRVALPADVVYRYVTELSEGQRQRVGIARALATGAKWIVADESFSGLDALTAEEVVRTFEQAYQQGGLTFISVTHDITMAWRLGERVIVMEEGGIIEDASTRRIFVAPKHSFTRELLAASVWADWLSGNRELPTRVGSGTDKWQ